MKVLVSSGGGVRIGASFGAHAAAAGRFEMPAFDYYAGCSAGSLHAALAANGWKPHDMANLFIGTDFKKLFTPALVPFRMRLAMAAQFPIALTKLAAFYDSLGLKPVDNLIITSVDSKQNKIIAYCEKVPDFVTENPSNGGHVIWRPKAFSELGYGRIMANSSALPGLKAIDPQMKDGGGWQNPPISIFPRDTDMLVFDLGYAGDANWSEQFDYPVSALDDALYFYEFKDYSYVQEVASLYPGMRRIFPNYFKKQAVDFDMSYTEKVDMVTIGFDNSMQQWLNTHPF